MKPPLVKRTWLRILIFIILYQLISFAFSLPAIWVVMESKGLSFLSQKENIQPFLNNHMMEFHFFAMPLIVLGTFSTLVFCRKLFDRRSVYSLGFQLSGYIWHFMAGLFLGVAALTLGFFALKWTNHLSVIDIHFDFLHLFGYASFFLFVSFQEEIVVRGYVMKNLMEGYGNKWVALAVSSIIFAAMHMANPDLSEIPILNLFLAGVLLGVYYMHRQNLWFPIGLHFTWNFFQGPIYGFKVSGLPGKGSIQQELNGLHWLTGGEFGFEGSLLCTAILVMSILGLHQLLKKSSVSILSSKN